VAVVLAIGEMMAPVELGTEDELAEQLRWQAWIDDGDVRRPRPRLVILVPVIVALVVVALSVVRRESGVSSRDVCRRQAAASLGPSAERAAIDGYVQNCVSASLPR
jgi:hypothetical protein